MRQRDMSQAEFDAKVKQYGFVQQGFMGYYQLPPPFSSMRVSVWNAGPVRRERLAYLLRMWKLEEAKR